MFENNQINVDANVSSVSRRSVLKAAAWSLPAIAVASAVPAFAASLEVAECQVEPGVWNAPAEGALHHNGQQGHVAGSTTNGGEVTNPSGGILAGGPVRTTGWTPVVPTGANALDSEWAENITTDWSAFAAASGLVGFMSMDDRNNTAANAGTGPVSFTVTFNVGVEAGKEYALTLPYGAASDGLALQYLDVVASVPGVGPQQLLAGRVGAEWASIALPNHTDYSVMSTGALQTLSTSFWPTENGAIVISYTFTLVEATGGTMQNADIWIGQPAVISCA